MKAFLSVVLFLVATNSFAKPNLLCGDDWIEVSIEPFTAEDGTKQVYATAVGDGAHERPAVTVPVVETFANGFKATDGKSSFTFVDGVLTYEFEGMNSGNPFKHYNCK